MITVEELAKIPLFSKLHQKELRYLSDVVPDIRLIKGEYLVHEGDPRGLYIPIEGRLEVTKIVDGVERIIGQRTHGQLFGEIPMMLNSPFPASMRSAELSRVTRIDPKVFHTVCAAAPEVSETVGAAALSRIEGLRDIASTPPTADLKIVGPRWDPAVQAMRSFLYGNQVPFDWDIPEDLAGVEPASHEVARMAGQFPVIELPDGTSLVAPSMREVAKSIGLSVAPSQKVYDVLIAGSGPAGLAAAVYGVSEGLSTVLLERVSPGGQAGTSSRIENYLGFPFGVSGDELASRALNQAKRFGAELVVTRSVEAIDPETRTVTLDGGEELHARAIVLSMGVTWRHLPIPSLARLTGKGVYYGAARSEACLIQGHDVFLIGAGNSSGQAAIYFSSYAANVTILCRSQDLSKSMSHYLIEQLKTKSNIRVMMHSEVVEVHGGEKLEAVDIVDRNTGKIERHGATALFILIGADASTGWLPSSIRRDANGYVLTGHEVAGSGSWSAARDPYLLETSVPGIFAVGDVRAGSVKRIAAGVGEGSMAIAFVHKFLASLTPS